LHAALTGRPPARGQAGGCRAAARRAPGLVLGGALWGAPGTHARRRRAAGRRQSAHVNRLRAPAQARPELYLRDVFRVLPHWPRDRYLELAQRYWSATRARLDPQELDQELGPLKVPEPALSTATSPVPAELRTAP
jgi:hypothetical protein